MFLIEDLKEKKIRIKEKTKKVICLKNYSWINKNTKNAYETFYFTFVYKTHVRLLRI